MLYIRMPITFNGSKLTIQIFLNRIRLFLAYIAVYLVIAVFFLIILMFVASAIITNSSNNELGRVGDGIFAIYVCMILSFLVISPSVLYGFFYWIDKKGKRKRRRDDQMIE